MSSGAESSPAVDQSPHVAADRFTQAGLLILLIAVTIVLAYLLVSLVLLLLGIGGSVPVGVCLTHQAPGHVTGPPLRPPTPLLDPPLLHWHGVLLGLCVLGFIAGGAWGGRRAAAHARALAATPDDTLGAPSTLLQVLLVALFLFGAAVLVWETFALAHVQQNPDIWPITFYVRCANDALGVPTLVGAVATSTLVGHWLSYQSRAGQAD